MSSMRVTYVSKKINKVKWKPNSCSMFVTGSWDDADNSICVWAYPSPSTIDESDEDIELDEPYIVNEAPFHGDVTDLKVVSDDLIFASSSLGSIHMFKYSNEKLQCCHVWDKVHHFSKTHAPATSISVKGHDLASAGEDGRLCIFNFNGQQQIREIASPDLCSFTAVSYLRHQEIVLGNSLGHLRTWDLRSASDQPSCSLIVSRDQMGVSSMNLHPSQPHILISGHEDGSLRVWDMRQHQRPTTVLAGHSEAVSEIMFHPTNPDYLYTCSLDGSLWQWDASDVSSIPTSTAFEKAPDATTGNSWLNCEANKHKLEVTSLFSKCISVNSLDLSGTMLLWGTDSEALYMLPDISI